MCNYQYAVAVPRKCNTYLLNPEVSTEDGVLCSPASKQGYAMHMYAASTSMTDCSFCNADGDFLIVPQLGLPHTSIPVTPCLACQSFLQMCIKNSSFS